MQIYTVPLPNSPDPGSRAQFRHYVMLEGGLVFYQDEQLHQDWKQMPTSERTRWERLPVPPEPDTVVSAHLIDDRLVMVLRSGASFMYLDGAWEPYAPPCPGTVADANE
jgi:hypothetical protein